MEREIYSFDHAQLGAHVAKTWEFSDAIVDAIAYHHDVDRYDGAHRELVFVVAAANYLCSRAGWTSIGVHNVSTAAQRNLSRARTGRSGPFHHLG